MELGILRRGNQQTRLRLFLPCKFDVIPTERNFASKHYVNTPRPQVGEEAADVIHFEMVAIQEQFLQLG